AYARHNDKTIKEHCIDKFVRPLRSSIHWTKIGNKPHREIQYVNARNNDSTDTRDSVYIILDSLARIAHCFVKAFKRYMTFPLDRKELIWILEGLRWSQDNIVNLMTLLHAHYTGKITLPRDELSYVHQFLNENIHSPENIFLYGYKYIYKKYERPRRLKRNVLRNKKLSDSYNYPPRTLPDPNDLSSVPAL